MMLLSRFWYAILSFCVCVAIYIVFVAVGQYNRRNQVAMTEGLAADSQVVRWALQIDSRRRLDALLIGAVDKGIQDSLVAANGKDKIPTKSKDEARKALLAINEKLPAEYKADALFAVDHDGRVVAQVGFDQANAFDDFELGGFPAVNDALHGFLRDDTWVLAGKIYRVSARPVEYDVSQPPAGAIVGLRSLDPRFAKDISKLTRTNVAFYASGVRVASAAGADGFDEKLLDIVSAEIPKVEADKAYQDTGRSGIRLVNEDLGATYARFEGDAWELRAGFVVARTRVSIAGPMGFLSTADDKDKGSVPWLLIVFVGLIGIGAGIAFTVFEHTLPMNEMVKQALRLKKGEIDQLQLPRFRGGFRGIATDINFGIDRVAEKGGAPRKQADLESILGPVPAQPSMSAFSFPLADQSSPASNSFPSRESGSSPGRPFPGQPGAQPQSGPRAGLVPGGPGNPRSTGPGTNPGINQGGHQGSNPGPASVAQEGAPTRPHAPPLPTKPAFPPNVPNIAPKPANANAFQQPVTSPTAVTPPGKAQELAQAAIQHAQPKNKPSGLVNLAGDDDDHPDESTVVGEVPREVLAQATGQHGAVNEAAEWLAVYEDFIRTKKQCGEPTDGLTFEKFQHTLKKNRDALIQRHGCKRVRFSVYVKEGRASLKATPVKE
ncbi:MAG: MXAN_5187 family protein [Polyangiaceae bacterium]